MGMQMLGREMYEMVNPQDGACNLCREMTNLINQYGEEAVYALPTKYGTGYLRKIVLNPFTTVIVYDWLFHRSITMQSMSDEESLKLNFNMGTSFQWGLEERLDHFTLEKEESCILPGGALYGTSSRHEAGLRYKGISIKLHPDRYESVLACFTSANAICDIGSQPACKTFRVTAAVMDLLRQILERPFTGEIGRLYVEGKILELLAVYLHEMVGQQGKGTPAIRLSGEDMRSLQRVKELLDESFAEPLTIAELAKAVYINEYKLKKGFKEIYGKPIYSYVIDRRMEMARQLLTEKQLKVKDAASMVGYTNISHFIETFRRKFGVNPGRVC